jgi:hypothetical protein
MGLSDGLQIKEPMIILKQQKRILMTFQQLTDNTALNRPLWLISSGK